MSRSLRFWGTIFLVLFLWISFSWAKSDYRFLAEIKVAPQKEAKLVEIWIPLPREDLFQKVRDLQISSPLPFEIVKEDEYNNKFLYVRHEGALKDSVTITIQALVSREEVKPDRWPEPLPRRYLLSDRLVPIDQFKEMAEEITRGQRLPLEKAQAIYDYVVSSMKYDKSGKGWGRGDAVWACDKKRGNCTDFHSLYIALVRSLNIPAVFEIGFLVPKGGGKIKGYHCWALVFPEGKVYGIDASEAAKHPEKKEYFFGHLDEGRIAITRGRDLLLAPPQHGKRINFLYKAYLEVDLEPRTKDIETIYYVYPYREN